MRIGGLSLLTHPYQVLIVESLAGPIFALGWSADVAYSRCVAVLLQWVAVCCSAMQCVAVCCSAIQCAGPILALGWSAGVAYSRCVCCKCVAVCYSVLQCVAVCGSVLQRVALCCSVLQCVAINITNAATPMNITMCVSEMGHVSDVAGEND